MTIDLHGKVAIVTGAGGGLGRQHALALARRGAKIVVNDLDLDNKYSNPNAQDVVREIKAAGGDAFAHGASVTDIDQVNAMVDEAKERWGKVDILVANAGILRDKTFAKMDLDDFRTVFDVHVMGSVNCAKAVWAGMRDQNYGRIIFTSSSSGLYGNFGQSNYGAAKMALVGLMNTLALEGAKYDIRVNCLAPTASTRMLEGLMSEKKLAALNPALVSPAVVALAAETAPTKTTICAGAGSFEVAHITLTKGLHLGNELDVADKILANLKVLNSTNNQSLPNDGSAQADHELTMANFNLKEVK